jgi:thiol-disulfide isomerase/thioredoxin
MPPAVVGSPGVCLVEFRADWCEPCVAAGRTLEEVLDDHLGD